MQINMVPILYRYIFIFIDLASDFFRSNLVQVSRCLPPCHEFYSLSNDILIVF